MKNILIIENNLKLLKNYADALKKVGYQVTMAPSSDNGIQLAINKLPDVIVCNTELTNIDGFEVLSTLSANPSTSKIPFIFINTDSNPEKVKRGIYRGANDFVTRPFNSNQLARSVGTQFNKHKNQNGSLLPIGDSEDSSQLNNNGLEKLFELISQSKTRQIKKKQTLYYEGDYAQWLYLVSEGCVKTFKLTNDGRQLITSLCKPNDFVGLDNLLLDLPFTENAEATEDSCIYFISKTAVIDLLNEHVDINQYFIKILSTNIHDKENQLVELAYESVRKRLAQVLTRLAKDVIPIDQIDITRDELAGLAGIANETVSRILTDFKERKLIERNGSQIQIIDLEGLLTLRS